MSWVYLLVLVEDAFDFLAISCRDPRRNHQGHCYRGEDPDVAEEVQRILGAEGMSGLARPKRRRPTPPS